MPSQYKPFSHFSVIRNFSNLQSSRSLQITLVGRNLFNDKQYVFRLARSTAGVLTAITNRISEALYNRYISRTIASGISKVWQNGLLQKLSRQGLPGSVFIFLFQLYFFFISNGQVHKGSFWRSILRGHSNRRSRYAGVTFRTNPSNYFTQMIGVCSDHLCISMLNIKRYMDATPKLDKQCGKLAGDNECLKKQT